MKSATLALLAIAVVADLALMASGRRVLVWASRVQAGHAAGVEGFEPAQQPTLMVCRYFTGTDIVRRVFMFARTTLQGRDECPFTIGPKE